MFKSLRCRLFRHEPPVGVFEVSNVSLAGSTIFGLGESYFYSAPPGVKYFTCLRCGKKIEV